MYDAEPSDAVPQDYIATAETPWTRALSGRMRRVFVFGGPSVPSDRYLPNAMGLEPVSQSMYKYDSEGALSDHAEHLRIAIALAAEDGWLANGWQPDCAGIFMRAADLVIWFDDAHARQIVSNMIDQQSGWFGDFGSISVDAAVKEAWRRAWHRRRHGEVEDRVSLLDVGRRARISDPLAPYVQMARFRHADKLLRVWSDAQIAALNSVRPNR